MGELLCLFQRRKSSGPDLHKPRGAVIHILNADNESPGFMTALTKEVCDPLWGIDPEVGQQILLVYDLVQHGLVGVPRRHGLHGIRELWMNRHDRSPCSVLLRLLAAPHPPAPTAGALPIKRRYCRNRRTRNAFRPWASRSDLPRRSPTRSRARRARARSPASDIAQAACRMD